MTISSQKRWKRWCLNPIGQVLVLLIVGLSLAGCTSTISPSTVESPPIASSTTKTIALTPTPSRELVLINTPIPTPTPVISSTETPLPTAIILPTSIFTPTPNPTPTPILINLPTWIIEPSANILLLGNYNPKTITVVNVDTQELHNIPVEANEYYLGWQWQDNRLWLRTSLQDSTDKMNVIDIMTGELTELSITRQSTISPNGRYVAQSIRQENGVDFVTITDYETGTKRELVNPFSHLQSRDERFNEYVISMYWSPDSSFLSVLYEKHYYSDNYDRHLAIYTSSGEIFQQYANTNLSIGNPWATPHKVLATNGWTPCILEITEGTKVCLESVKEWFVNQNTSPSNYIWSPDGERISFIHADPDMRTTGMCYIELETEDIVCPVSSEDFRLETQMYLRFQFWSSDAKYLVLFSDSHGIPDVIGSMKVAVLDVDDQGFWLLEGEYSWSFYNPWRPLIPPETEPLPNN
ncbi:MAG: hypothetical protein OT477_21620 [Chloroflexi bacterium]|nr:hypothetical protein [Chloroflexota bacterium]